MRLVRELGWCAAVVCVVGGLTTPAMAATFEAVVSSSGSVAAEAAPIGCVHVASVSITLQNNDTVDDPTTLTVALPAGLTAIAGSCEASLGSCMIVDPSTVTWSGTIPAGQSAVVLFNVLVDPGLPPDAKVCLELSGQFGSHPPFMVEACGFAGRCDVAAPALGGVPLTLLAALLATGGWVLVRRRMRSGHMTTGTFRTH